MQHGQHQFGAPKFAACAPDAVKDCRAQRFQGDHTGTRPLSSVVAGGDRLAYGGLDLLASVQGCMQNSFGDLGASLGTFVVVGADSSSCYCNGVSNNFCKC